MFPLRCFPLAARESVYYATSRSDIQSLGFAFLLQPLLRAAGMTAVSSRYFFTCYHVFKIYLQISTEHKNDFLEGMADFLRVPIKILATEKNKSNPWKCWNLVHKTSIESVSLLFGVEQGGAVKGRKAFFFSKYLKKKKYCLFVTSLNSRSFKQANRKRPRVATHPSSTFKRWKEKALFPFLRLASLCLCCPGAPWGLADPDGEAWWSPHPFKTVAFDFFFTGDCPGAYEAKSVFEQSVKQQA